MPLLPSRSHLSASSLIPFLVVKNGHTYVSNGSFFAYVMIVLAIITVIIGILVCL